MKILKKVNRGLLLTILVLIVVGVYVVTLVKEVNGLKTEVEKEATEFLSVQAECMVIPEDFQEDPDAYVAKIEPLLKGFFAEEEAYQFYIENNILSQYKNKMFYKDYFSELNYLQVNRYEQGILSVSLSVQSQGTLPDNTVSGSGGFHSFQYKNVGGAMKIYYLNISNAGQPYATYQG